MCLSVFSHRGKKVNVVSSVITVSVFSDRGIWVSEVTGVLT